MKLKNIIISLIALTPLFVWSNIIITEADGSLAGSGHARSHDFPVEAEIFTIQVSETDTSGNRSISVEVSVNDLHTGNAMRDSHMRMSVLDRKKHPLITFSSKIFMPQLQAGDIALPGELQVNGVTKPYTFNLRLDQSAGKWKAIGNFQIIPTDFDLPLVGFGPMKVLDKVDLVLEVQFLD